jgi:hypothetical protein
LLLAERYSFNPQSGLGGGRTWWAHFEFTRINIGPTILRKKIEELMNVRGVGEKNFLKLKDQISVGNAKADHDQPPPR